MYSQSQEPNESTGGEDERDKCLGRNERWIRYACILSISKKISNSQFKKLDYCSYSFDHLMDAAWQHSHHMPFACPMPVLHLLEWFN